MMELIGGLIMALIAAIGAMMGMARRQGKLKQQAETRANDDKAHVAIRKQVDKNIRAMSERERVRAKYTRPKDDGH